MLKHKIFLRGLLWSGLALLMGVITWQAEAQENPLSFDTPVNGEIAAGETARWQFEAYRDDVILLTVTRTDGDLQPVLSLFDSEGQLQAQIQGDVTGNAALTYRIPRFGQYIVQISPQSETIGTLTLTLTLEESGRRDFEQGEVFYGQPIVQVLDDDIPYHTWTFEGQTAQVVDITVTVLEGDLQPIIALTSPGGIALGRAETDLNPRQVRLLAERLPGSGAYEVLVRRAGGNFGFDGTTSGRYQLEITLRNGADATANSLNPEETVQGRLTLDSPLARYSLEAVGKHLIEVELARPNCLVDLTVFSNGVARRVGAVAASPIIFPVDFIGFEAHILEIASAGCPNVDDLDFVLRVSRYEAEFPLYTLPANRTVFGKAELQRWIFKGTSGDLVRLSARQTDLRSPLGVRVIAPDGNQIYRSATLPTFDQTLTLSQDGFYIVEVTPSTSPYTLSSLLVGQQNRLFSVQPPAQEQVLDVQDTRTWSITASEQATVLVVYAPDGEIVASARAGNLNPPRLDALVLATPGRYRIHVFGADSFLNIEEVFAFENILLTEGKSILSDSQDYHRWELPLQAGQLLKLRLENLTPDTPLPAVSLLDQNGQLIPSQYQLENGSTFEFIGLQPTQDSKYTVLVNNNGAGEQLTYRLLTDIETAFTPAEDSLVSVSTPLATSFIPTAQTASAKDFLAPALTPADRTLLESAESVSLPNVIRGEILPNQRRQFWRLNIVRGQLISFSITSLENKPAPGLTLLNAEGTIILEHWERQESVNQVSYRTPIASAYFLVITDDPEGGAYLIDARIIADVNETIPTVTPSVPLTIEQPVSGEFLSTDDNETDTYTFWGRLNDIVEIAVVSTGIPAQITLLGERGNLIATAELNVDENITRLQSPSLPDNGLYTVSVSPLEQDSDEEPIYGQYTLFVSPISGQADDGGVLDGEVYGSISNAFEEDVWLFQGQAGESVTLEIDPLTLGAPSGLTIALADSTGETFYVQQSLLAENKVIVQDVMLPRTGLYQARVSAETPGRYQLRLNFNRAYLQSGDHATAYGATVSGVFTQGNIVDRWVFAGNQGDVIAVALRPVRGDITSVGFEVESPDGTIVGLGVDAGLNTGARVENIILPTTGIYSIFVGTPDAFFTGALAYDLSLERQNRTARSSGTLLPYGITASGIVYADDTRDVWFFEGTEGDIVEIGVTGDGVLEPAFSLTAFDAPRQDGQLQPLASRTGTSTEPARLVDFVIPATGAYAITVSGVGGATGAYTLHINPVQQTALAAQSLPIGTTQEDDVDANTPQRWTFQGTRGDTLSITVNPIRRSQLAPMLLLYAPSGELLVQQSGLSDEIVTLSAYQLPTTGIYSVFVQPAFSGDTQGRYEISATLESNGVVTPNPIAYNDAAISALSDNIFEQTWFFDGQAGDVIALRAFGTSGDLDTTLTLTDSEGNVLAQNDDATTTDAEIIFTVPATARYLVEIARFGEADGYTAGNYRLDLVLLYRPGSVTNTHYLTYGERVIQQFQPAADFAQNWYFVGQANDIINLNVQFPSSNIPLRLILSDSGGNILQEGLRVRERSTLANFTLPADGIYRILIQPTRRITTDEYIPYALSLDLLAGRQTPTPEGGFIQPNTSISGDFINGDPVHLWLYSGQAGEQLSLSLLRLSGTTAPSVTVFTPDGRILATLPTTQERNTINLPLLLPAAGVYPITVTSSDSFATYRLSLNSGQFQTIAGQLVRNQTEFGLLSDLEPIQVWLLDALAGENLAVQAIGELDFSIRVEDSFGVVLASSQPDPTTGQIIVPPTALSADDTYRIIVTRHGGTLGTAQGRYQLRVSDTLSIPASLYAPTLENGVAILGSVENQHAARYTLYAEPTTPISLEFLPTVGENRAQLRVVDDEGTLLTTSTGTIENLLVKQAGFYLVEVTNPTPLSFTLTYAARPISSSAEVLERATTTLGELTTRQPIQSWAFEAEAGDTIQIELDAFTTAMRPDLILFDPDGLPLSMLVSAEDEIVLGAIFIPRDGTYTLRVGNWLNFLPIAEMSYSVRVISADAETELGSRGGTIVAPGEPVFGGVSQNDPLDQWTFEAVAGSTLSLALRTTLGDAKLTLELLSPDETLLEITLTEIGNRLTADDLLAPVNGTYTINVRQAQQNSADSTAYELVVQTTRTPIENALAQAQGVAVGQTVTGEIATTAESDAWIFLGTQGQTLTFTADSATTLILVSPAGTPLAASENGILEQILLLEDGVYSVVVSAGDEQAPLTYTLTIQVDPFRSNWRWSLNLGVLEQAVLTPTSPVHEWQLAGYHVGEYIIMVRPTSNLWQAKTFVLDEQNQVVASGELQADGSSRLSLYLDSADGKQYSLLVTSDVPGGSYQVLFDAGINTTTPEPLPEGITMTGRIDAFDTADEWLWLGSPSQPLTVEAARLEGDFTLSIRIFAPGNLFLQEFFADENGRLRAENILLPVEGTYIIQVVRTEDSFSDAQGIYELRATSENE